MNEKEWSKLCLSCQWCCGVQNTPVPFNEGYNTQEEFAYLYWMKGRKVYWEPFTKEWYVLESKPCRFLDPKRGCSIYERRPRLCREGFCPFPGRMHERYELLCRAGDRIMRIVHNRGIY